jgi:transcriptional regulator with XRE-family HTH domain
MYSINPTPYQIAKELSLRHRAIRKQLKLSQVELADRSGVSLGSLKRFESTGQISLESLLKLAHLLDRLSDFEPVFQPQEDIDKLERLFNSKP